MELSIRRVAKTSSLSGDPFSEGQLVESFLYRNAENELERADLGASEVAGWSPPGPLLCRWQHRLKPHDDAAEARQQSLAGAEELFLALVDPDEASSEDIESSPEEAENRAILINLLGLLLERKRVIKPVKGRRGRFYYGPEKRELEVPRVELEPARILPLIEELDSLL